MKENILSSIINNTDLFPKKTAIILAEPTQTTSISYAELHQHILNLAAFLNKENYFQQRALLIFPTGIDFIIGFLACLHAGIVAIPVAIPSVLNFKKIMPLINSIKEDSGANLILTNTNMLTLFFQFSASIDEFKIKVLDINKIDLNEKSMVVEQKWNNTSHLQYSSGSTSSPKGVITTHENLITVLNACAKSWKINLESISVNWAPHSHVYGLVCGILLPLFKGNTAVLMAPENFIYQPLSWLKLISTYKANYSGCPNFGYELCSNQYQKNPDLMESVDLHSWHAAINGGELVREQTLKTFAKLFKPYGFDKKNFCSAYGMSENAGLIASTIPRKKIAIKKLSKSAILSGKIANDTTEDLFRTIVSSGLPIETLRLSIVDPDTHNELPENHIGEIWFSGPTVSPGYWQRPEETKINFGITIKDKNKNYFRTGDLGFMSDGQLFITGRLKELVCAYGQKFYAHDLEKLVAESHPHFTFSTNAIFSSIIEGKEKIVLVQEISNEKAEENWQLLIKAIRSKLSKDLNIDCHHIIFVKSGTIPKTPSGKLQRLLCKKLYEEGKLTFLYDEYK